MTLILAIIYCLLLLLCVRAPRLSGKRPVWASGLIPHGAILAADNPGLVMTMLAWAGLAACTIALFTILPASTVLALNVVAVFVLSAFIVAAGASLRAAYEQALAEKLEPAEDQMMEMMLRSGEHVLIYAAGPSAADLHAFHDLSAHLEPTAVENIYRLASGVVLRVGYMPDYVVWIPWGQEFNDALIGGFERLREHVHNMTDQCRALEKDKIALNEQLLKLTTAKDHLEKELSRTRAARKGDHEGGVKHYRLSDFALMDEEQLQELLKQFGTSAATIQRVLDQRRHKGQNSTTLFGEIPMGEPVHPVSDHKTE